MTVPNTIAAKMGDKPLSPWNLSLDDFFIEQRKLTIVNYAVRVLLPLIFDAEPFKETAEALRNQPVIHDDQGIADSYEAIKGLYEKIAAVLGEGLGDADRSRWELAEDILHSVRWVLEAGLQHSSVVGPMIVHTMDLLAEWFSWDGMIDYADHLFQLLLDVHLSFN